MLVVQLWKGTVATPFVHVVPSMEAPDQGAVAENREGLWVGEPKGASAEMAVEGRCCRGGGGVFGKHEGGQPCVGRDDEG